MAYQACDMTHRGGTAKFCSRAGLMHPPRLALPRSHLCARAGLQRCRLPNAARFAAYTLRHAFQLRLQQHRSRSACSPVVAASAAAALSADGGDQADGKPLDGRAPEGFASRQEIGKWALRQRWRAWWDLQVCSSMM